MTPEQRIAALEAERDALAAVVYQANFSLQSAVDSLSGIELSSRQRHALEQIRSAEAEVKSTDAAAILAAIRRAGALEALRGLPLVEIETVDEDGICLWVAAVDYEHVLAAIAALEAQAGEEGR
jgi:hypothetical protein